MPKTSNASTKTASITTKTPSTPRLFCHKTSVVAILCNFWPFLWHNILSISFLFQSCVTYTVRSNVCNVKYRQFKARCYLQPWWHVSFVFDWSRSARREYCWSRQNSTMRDLPLALIRYCTSAAPRNYDFQPQINPHFSFLKGAFRLKII